MTTKHKYKHIEKLAIKYHLFKINILIINAIKNGEADILYYKIGSALHQQIITQLQTKGLHSFYDTTYSAIRIQGWFK